MYKNIQKTESVAEFVARGGEIKKVPPKQFRKKFTKAMEKAAIEEQIDISALPQALRIKFGLR